MEGKDKNDFKDFTDLDVWKLGHELRLKVYILIRYLPKDERYNVISQVKRSAGSVCPNIAEGYGRFHYQESIQFCRQARGSLEETKDHLIFIRDAKLIKKISSVEHLINLCDQTKVKLNGYISYLKKRKKDDPN